mmetsp:Transcript_1304/g.3757  ORF Transcript_1304/g.3757 Transcript_1304/m.3757 type:complete len:264 (+) Transcript_1304:111-902(+)
MQARVRSCTISRARPHVRSAAGGGGFSGAAAPQRCLPTPRRRQATTPPRRSDTTSRRSRSRGRRTPSTIWVAAAAGARCGPPTLTRCTGLSLWLTRRTRSGWTRFASSCTPRWRRTRCAVNQFSCCATSRTSRAPSPRWMFPSDWACTSSRAPRRTSRRAPRAAPTTHASSKASSGSARRSPPTMLPCRAAWSGTWPPRRRRRRRSARNARSASKSGKRNASASGSRLRRQLLWRRPAAAPRRGQGPWQAMRNHRPPLPRRLR